MANKASKPVGAGPDASVIAALATNPAALAAYMATFSVQSAPQQMAKVANVGADLSGIAKAVGEGKSEVRTTVKGKPYAVIKFDFGGKQQNLNVWL